MKRAGSLALASIAAAACCLVIPAQETPPPPTEPAYRLMPGDVVEIKLFFNPELNEQAQIRPDGRLSLHFVGEAQLAGKTISEATAMLEQLYKKEVRTPKVLLQVKTFAGQKVYVTGEVFRPGPMNLPGPLTLFEAISDAGGIRTNGDPNLAILIRRGPDGKPTGRKVTLNVKGVMTAEAATPLSPFDVVIVPESRIARVDRWVDQHIRQLIPINVSAGFTYLFQNAAGPIIPIL